ncbi:hypothetical protein D9758_017206 [Tetrapyrgos nigripes]|uniref:Uncharacterized protein n=1 Tax=Tetrapyrgos nigripes TaxID=182062 RepID=A0A8H5C0V2_9AGAR|nr:hypothetical protein D9758_017206 [Tetrapyrgos nigripes]
MVPLLLTFGYWTDSRNSNVVAQGRKAAPFDLKLRWGFRIIYQTSSCHSDQAGAIHASGGALRVRETTSAPLTDVTNSLALEEEAAFKQQRVQGWQQTVNKEANHYLDADQSNTSEYDTVEDSQKLLSGDENVELSTVTKEERVQENLQGPPTSVDNDRVPPEHDELVLQPSMTGQEGETDPDQQIGYASAGLQNPFSECNYSHPAANYPLSFAGPDGVVYFNLDQQPCLHWQYLLFEQTYHQHYYQHYHAYHSDDVVYGYPQQQDMSTSASAQAYDSDDYHPNSTLDVAADAGVPSSGPTGADTSGSDTNVASGANANLESGAGKNNLNDDDVVEASSTQFEVPLRTRSAPPVLHAYGASSALAYESEQGVSLDDVWADWQWRVSPSTCPATQDLKTAGHQKFAISPNFPSSSTRMVGASTSG